MNFYQPTELQKNAKIMENGKVVQEANSQQQPVETITPKDGKCYTPEELRDVSNTAIVEKIVYPQAGGVLSYMRYYKYPYKGFPVQGYVHLMASFKGLMPVFAAFIRRLIKNPFSWITIKLAIDDAFPVFIEHAHKLLEPYFPERPSLYCQCVRELRKGFNEIGIPETQTRNEQKKTRRDVLLKELDTHIKLRNILCFILEFDNAYRYRFQDILAELNKVAFEKNPVQELSRLFDILIERERYPHMKKKWSNLKTLFTFYLKVAQRKKEMIKNLLLALNINEIKPQEDDWYYLEARTDYSYGGKKLWQ